MKTKNSNEANFSFVFSDSNWKKDNTREGEIKLSETLKFGNDVSKCAYIILGISEDIGPQMNNGLPGAKNGFHTFLTAFQNIQSNRFLKGNEIGILGEIIQNKEFEDHLTNKNCIEELDDFVFKVLEENTNIEQTIIVIGGGHNNAYPLLKYAKSNSANKIHALNIDPHADCRKTDFRHSGNPFSCAIEEGLVQKYSIIGLHQSYNSEYIYNFIDNNSIDISYFEDYIDNPDRFWNSLNSFSDNLDTKNTYTLDLDLDAITNVASSAFTPSGFSVEECRKIVRHLSSKIKFKHFHLPEGAPISLKEHKKYGKLISYLIADFIKNQKNLEK